MFCGINLCGAEVNTKFSEQHRTHLSLHNESFFIAKSLLIVNQTVEKLNMPK